MNGRHLTDEELDLLLSGDRLSREAEKHVSECLLCRHRQSSFLGAVAAAREPSPDERALEVARSAALSRWTDERPTHRWRWLAVAAVLFLIVLVPVIRRSSPPAASANAEALLQEIDAVLARDPLTAMAPAELVEAVIPSVEAPTEGSAS